MAKQGMRTPVGRLQVQDTADRLAALHAAADEVRAAGGVRERILQEAPDRRVDFQLTVAGQR